MEYMQTTVVLNLYKRLLQMLMVLQPTRPLEYRDYYVKEISQSEGTKIDGTTYTASAANAQDVNGQRVVNVGSTNPVIYGGFRMIVSVSDLTGDTTKEPAVGSKLKLTLNSNPNEYYETVVDEHGYADFTDIPYGSLYMY